MSAVQSLDIRLGKLYGLSTTVLGTPNRLDNRRVGHSLSQTDRNSQRDQERIYAQEGGDKTYSRMDCDGDETERGWALMVAYHTPVSEAGRNRSETHWRCLQIALSTWYLTASGSRSELERPGTITA